MITPSPIASPRFDSNRAWLDASGIVSANRDMLIALAGVFISLPVFALQALLPFPDAESGTSQEQLVALVGAYLQQNWVAFGFTIIIELFGMLVILALLSDRSRPTVGGAMKLALIATGPFLVGLTLLFLTLPVFASLPGALLGLSGSTVLASFGLGIGLVGMIYVLARLALFGPALLVEGRRNPFTAMRRSWAMTQGNGWRLTAFLVLLFIAFRLVAFLAIAVVHLLATLAIGAKSAVLAALLIDGLMQGALLTCLVAVLVAVHHQLAGTATIQSVVDKFQ